MAKSIIDYKKTLTKEEIKKVVEENNIEFIKLEFCDINGIMKNLSHHRHGHERRGVRAD